MDLSMIIILGFVAYLVLHETRLIINSKKIKKSSPKRHLRRVKK